MCVLRVTVEVMLFRSSTLHWTCSESYDGAGAEFTRQELRALFDVIGTPTWADIEDVQSTPWRRYLEARHLPSRQAQAHGCG